MPHNCLDCGGRFTPYLAISKLMQSLKGKTSYKLLSEYKDISRQFWGRHIWGTGLGDDRK